MMQTSRRISSTMAMASTVVAIAAVVHGAPRTLAQTPPPQSLIGQCRAVNKRTPIYISRDPISAALILLNPDTTVILAENAGSNGMIAINHPQAGFVSTANLKRCTAAAKPAAVAKPAATAKPGTQTKPVMASQSATPSPALCRKVAPPQGLIVRREAGITAAQIGSVAATQKVTLVTPPQSRQLEDGRIWVRIASPIRGWVSDGVATDPARNLAPCN